MDTLTPTVEDPAAADVRDLLTRHFELMRAQSPAESCHVLEPDPRAFANATLLGLRENGLLLAIGALAPLDDTHAELKSMHTAASARGRGLGRVLLHALLEHGRKTGIRTVSLETGTAADFAAARALYHSAGFQDCPPFGSYVYDPLSVFMTRSV